MPTHLFKERTEEAGLGQARVAKGVAGWETQDEGLHGTGSMSPGSVEDSQTLDMAALRVGVRLRARVGVRVRVGVGLHCSSGFRTP